MSIVSFQDVKEYLDEADTQYEGLFELYVARAQKFMESYCNREFLQDASTRTEYHDGGINTICVLKPPIDSATGVTVYDDPDRDFGSNTQVDADDFGIDCDNGILKFDYTLYVGRQSVKVIYKGGWALTSVPIDLKQICVELAVRKYRSGVKGELGVPSRSLPDGSVVYSLNELTPTMQQALDFYRLPLSR